MKGGAWAGIGKTYIVEIDTTGGTAKPGPLQLFFTHGGYNGGLSWDEKYLAAGAAAIHIVMMDLQSNRTLPDTVDHLFPVNPPYETKYGSNSCNASISTSRIFTNLVMHIDGGSSQSSTPMANFGKPWSEWQVILIIDDKGNLKKQYPYPKVPIETLPDSTNFGNKVRWHHPEWSNHPYFACATLNAGRSYYISGSWKSNDYQERIFLIDLFRSTNHEILAPAQYLNDPGAGVYWPYLWVDVPATFQEDPNWMNTINSVKRIHTGKNFPIVSFDGNIVQSSTPLRSVTIHSLLGQQLKTVKLAAGSRSVEVRPDSKLSRGIYFVRVLTNDGKHQVFRWTLSK
jgi:hypothetical protein